MKLIGMCLVFFAVVSFANEKSYFGYGDVHAMAGYPMTGGGIRYQKGAHALDLSGNICPLAPPIFHLRSLYLWYPIERGLYCGTGLGLLNEPESRVSISGSVEAVIGFQWLVGEQTSIFLEVDGIMPFRCSPVLSRIWPGVTLGFGF